ncbi:MAG: toxin HicA [Firmicutes bacterium]|nr:toxin HicA [Bacillota bacterium]
MVGKFDELERLLLHVGFLKRQPRKGSSHYVFSKAQKHISIPYRQPHILLVYVEMAIEALAEEFETEK